MKRLMSLDLQTLFSWHATRQDNVIYLIHHSFLPNLHLKNITNKRTSALEIWNSCFKMLTSVWNEKLSEKIYESIKMLCKKFWCTCCLKTNSNRYHQLKKKVSTQIRLHVPCRYVHWSCTTIFYIFFWLLK